MPKINKKKFFQWHFNCHSWNKWKKIVWQLFGILLFLLEILFLTLDFNDEKPLLFSVFWQIFYLSVFNLLHIFYYYFSQKSIFLEFFTIVYFFSQCPEAVIIAFKHLKPHLFFGKLVWNIFFVLLKSSLNIHISFIQSLIHSTSLYNIYICVVQEKKSEKASQRFSILSFFCKETLFFGNLSFF